MGFEVVDAERSTPAIFGHRMGISCRKFCGVAQSQFGHETRNCSERAADGFGHGDDGRLLGFELCLGVKPVRFGIADGAATVLPKIVGE